MSASANGVSAKDVGTFCAICVHARALHQNYKILFESGRLRKELLAHSAPYFFDDIYQMLPANIILQICKLTDPEESKGLKNLTTNFLVNNSDFSTAPGELVKLKQLNERINTFRKKILPARHKYIAHLDRDSVLSGDLLGGARPKEWEAFWNDIQDFAQIIHKHYLDPSGHFYINDISPISDADQLVRALKESTYFRTLLDDNTFTQKCADVAFNSKFYEA